MNTTETEAAIVLAQLLERLDVTSLEIERREGGWELTAKCDRRTPAIEFRTCPAPTLASALVVVEHMHKVTASIPRFAPKGDPS